MAALHLMIGAIMAAMNNDQLGFEFLPDLPTAPAVPKKRAVSKTAAPTTAAVPLPMEPEAMAQMLEAHPDFQVLRRLKPRLNWPGTTTAGVTRVAVLDTETTGLDQTKDQIIELAIVLVDVDNATGLPVGAVQVYDGLEDPGRPIPKEVVAITGITDADVQGQRLDEARVAELMRGVDLVIAHNAGFDRPFVESRLPYFSQFPWAYLLPTSTEAQGRDL